MTNKNIPGNLGRLESSPQSFHGMIFDTCPAMHRVFHLIRKVAVSDSPVLITGATGTGKEMAALAIHQRSRHAKGSFVTVNCGAIPGQLMESELFGHEKGAFTGAYRTVVGKVELAHGGTLFLDEVGELPLELQVKFLRFLQDENQTFERVGGRQTRKVNLRVIAGTNRDLKAARAAGLFREDLYYRLAGITIGLPDLKDRDNDVLILAKVFLRRFAGEKISGFTQEALDELQNHSWPGNVRELINRIHRAVIMAEGRWVTPENLGFDPSSSRDTSPAKDLSLREALDRYQANLVAEALSHAKGKVALAAKNLKTHRSVIYHLINKYDLKVNNSL